jgi:hypothetical protein
VLANVEPSIACTKEYPRPPVEKQGVGRCRAEREWRWDGHGVQQRSSVGGNGGVYEGVDGGGCNTLGVWLPHLQLHFISMSIIHLIHAFV